MNRPDRATARWQLRLEAARSGADSLPEFLRIARAIAEDIRRGRLPPEARLPGSRELARSLGVHRNTVLAAYRELMSEGFIETQAGRGTFVAATLPQVEPGRSRTLTTRTEGRSHDVGFPFEGSRDRGPSALPPKGAVLLYGGVPDTRLLPRAALARAYRRALRGPVDLLGYGDARGEMRLREALAQMLRSTRGLAVTAEDILVTRGSQMALSLLGRVLIRPGDRVAVEAYGYRPAWGALQQHEGVSLVPIAVDADGVSVEALSREHARRPIRALYLTPHHQYPTTVTLSAARRMELLAFARREHMALIEDDYDHEFHYDGRPVLPLASADEGGNVVYVGTLSKGVAPALRVGYLVAPAVVLEAALATRIDLDRQGDRVGERALAELMEDGELQRHLWRARRIYQARRDHFVRLMRDSLGHLLDFRVPPGGMALWVRASPELDVTRWHREALAQGVAFQPGSQFRFDGKPMQYARFGYAALDEDELAAAVRKLCAAADRALVKKRLPTQQRRSAY